MLEDVLVVAEIGRLDATVLGSLVGSLLTSSRVFVIVGFGAPTSFLSRVLGAAVF